MSDRKFLSSTEALGLGEPNARAPRRLAKDASAADAARIPLAKWGGRILEALAAEPEGMQAPSEVFRGIERASAIRFDFLEVGQAARALEADGVIEQVDTADGVALKLTRKGRAML